MYSMCRPRHGGGSAGATVGDEHGYPAVEAEDETATLK